MTTSGKADYYSAGHISNYHTKSKQADRNIRAAAFYIAVYSPIFSAVLSGCFIRVKRQLQPIYSHNSHLRVETYSPFSFFAFAGVVMGVSAGLICLRASHSVEKTRLCGNRRMQFSLYFLKQIVTNHELAVIMDAWVTYRPQIKK